MADENVTVKASTEVKARYEELKSKSGLTSKDFFELVLSQHEISNVGKEVEQSLDIPQIRTHLSALEAIFLSQIQKSIDTNQFFNSKITQENDSHKTLVDELQQSKMAAIAERDEEEEKSMKVIVLPSSSRPGMKNLSFNVIPTSQRSQISPAGTTTWKSSETKTSV